MAGGSAVTDIKVGDKVRVRTDPARGDGIVTHVRPGICVVGWPSGTSSSGTLDLLERVGRCIGWETVRQDPEWWPPQVHDFVQIGTRRGHYGDGGWWLFLDDGSYVARFDNDHVLALHHEHGSKLLFRLTPTERGEDR